MRIVYVLMFALLFLGTALAQQEERPRCENCGMFWDKSATRVEFTVKVDGKQHTHQTECFGCLHDFVHETYGEVMPTAISVLDYATYGTKNEKMIDAFDAFFLYGTERLDGSMPPYVAAFSSEEAAMDYEDELGGELVDFPGMRKLMMKAKGEDAGDSHDGHDHPAPADAIYVCPCSGDCCADISSSSPGECPNCGMQLVKKDQG
jgi:hypothetical protein